MPDNEVTEKVTAEHDIRELHVYFMDGGSQIDELRQVVDFGLNPEPPTFRGHTKIAGFQSNEEGQTRQVPVPISFPIPAATIKEATELFRELEKEAQDKMVAKLNSKIVVAGAGPPPPRLSRPGDNGKRHNRNPRNRHFPRRL